MLALDLQTFIDIYKYISIKNRLTVNLIIMFASKIIPIVYVATLMPGKKIVLWCISFTDGGADAHKFKNSLCETKVKIYSIFQRKKKTTRKQVIHQKHHLKAVLLRFFFLWVHGTGYTVNCSTTWIKEENYHQLSHLVGKPTMWFPNRSDTNWSVPSQKMARSLKFWI